MRAAMPLLCLVLPATAAVPLRVAAVERSGWPPFEDDRRIYRLVGENAPRLRPGEVLQLHRRGDPCDPGRLRVAGVDGAGAIAYLETRGSTYPLIGDEAHSRRADPPPRFPSPSSLPDLALRLPKPAVPEEVPLLRPAAEPPPHGAAAATPPARREPVFFLEGDGSLSPKGREKLERIVREWGAGGRWVLAVPEDKVLPEKVRAARLQALRRALVALGVNSIDLREAPRPEAGSADVVYVENGGPPER